MCDRRERGFHPVSNRALYKKALDALNEAHKACFNHPDRPLLGMSHGPFSGVNVALGIIARLEDENDLLRQKYNAKLSASGD